MTKRPHFRRDLSDQVARRAAHLPPADRALLLAALDRGIPTTELAAMSGRDVRSVRLRVRRLARRVLSEPYAFVLRNRGSWPLLRRRIATAVIVHGQTVKQAAAETGTSFYNARKHMDAIQFLIDASLGK